MPVRFSQMSSARRSPFGWIAALAPILGALILGIASPIGAETGIPRHESTEGAEVFFITPSAGQVVSSPFIVQFGLKNMKVSPAGVPEPGGGHHHLIVDADLPPANLPVPTSDHYRHFGKGQTEVALELPPGKHTLQLLLADHNHVPHDPPVVSKRITVEVK